MNNSESMKVDYENMESHPWRRFFARLFDVFVLGYVITNILKYVGIVLPTNFIMSLFSSVRNMAIFVIIETILISNFGTTLGKYLLGIRVLDEEGYKISLGRAFKRSFGVFAFGEAFGIVVLNFFANFKAYDDLSKEGITRWDKNCGTKVMFNKVHVIKYVIFIAVIVAPYIIVLVEGLLMSY